MREINSYPMFNSQVTHPTMSGTLGRVPCTKHSVDRVIDITNSSTVPANELRRKLDVLQIDGVNDAGLPVISHGALVGLLPAVAVESVLKEIEEIINSNHQLSTQSYGNSQEGITIYGREADLTAYIDKVRLCSLIVSNKTFPLILRSHQLFLKQIPRYSLFTIASRTLGYRIFASLGIISLLAWLVNY